MITRREFHGTSRTPGATSSLVRNQTEYKTQVGCSFCSSGMVLGVVRLSIEQLEIFACGELPAQLWNNRCGDFLFFRIGRPAEAETLSSLAGDQHRAGKRREWRAAGCAAGIERRQRARWGGGGCSGGRVRWGGRR